MTRKTLPISAAAGLRSVQLGLPLTVAIFAATSTYVVCSGLAFLLGGLVSRLLWAVLA